MSHHTTVPAEPRGKRVLGLAFVSPDFSRSVISLPTMWADHAPRILRALRRLCIALPTALKLEHHLQKLDSSALLIGNERNAANQAWNFVRFRNRSWQQKFKSKSLDLRSSFLFSPYPMPHQGASIWIPENYIANQAWNFVRFRNSNLRY